MASFRPTGSARLSQGGQDQVIRGVLQFVASTYLGQIPQQRSGEHELHDGIKSIEEGRAKSRAFWAKKRNVDAALKKHVDTPKRRKRKGSEDPPIVL